MIFAQVSSALSKRAMDYTVAVVNDPNNPENPFPQYRPWEWVAIIANFLIIIPIIVLSSYTIQKVLPVLAIVEDENPPAYEPVALDDEALVASASIPGAPQSTGIPKPASAAVPTRPLNLGEGTTPITKSVRATWRLWKSYGGFRSIFRGFACAMFQDVIISIAAARSLHSVVGLALSLVAPLLLVQFSTAWVHIVMTPPAKQHFWRRLPPFKRTLAATWRPVALLWLFTRGFGFLLYVIVPGTFVPRKEDSQNLWFVFFMMLFIFIRFLLAIPAYVVLIRVQASLLPDEQETIIPFDRSFQGKVEPTVVGGTGYASMRDAWETFTRAAWRRFIIFSIKIAVLGTAIFVFMFVFLTPSLFILHSGNARNGSQGGSGDSPQ